MTSILRLFLTSALTFTCLLNASANSVSSPMNHNSDVLVDMNTSLGQIRLLLYGDTPAHLNNFVKLVNEGYYDGVLFHRVINDFMIQTGDPDSREATPGQHLGAGGPDYKIDAEIIYPKHFHKRGALAAARQADAVNPQRQSSGSQFYIVTGRTYTPEQLAQFEKQMIMSRKQEIFRSLADAHRDTIMTMRRNRDQAGLQAMQERLAEETERKAETMLLGFTPEQTEVYTTLGGTPHLDGSYTVFGEVVSGMDIVDKIQKVETDSADRPKEDVRVISMKVVKE
ncbi:MAG: peptidylprolyl isomerase [Paramuribaculum sp.]|nr:peptidylprolyl isomerase [Paramuribaculum sp.]